MKKILCVVGTRPEAIKMAAVILALKKQQSLEVKVLATAQHREMLDQVLDYFDIKPDIDLNLMKANQSLAGLTALLLEKVDNVLLAEKPDVVLVQGDTTTVMAVALACFYRGIPIGHVEAGLRTGDMTNPFPEEANRVITAKLAKWHFAPTESARSNLLNEKIADQAIVVTGNTVIDALMMAVAQKSIFKWDFSPERRMVLVTAHRRENFGQPFENICRALLQLATNNPEVEFLYAVHPNPNIKEVAQSILGACKNIQLSEPLGYAQFVAAMQRAYFILSDSGGVQEEAPALGKPVLVLRSETERPEAVEAGVVKLVGTNFDSVVREAQTLLDDPLAYRAMARGISPYGDGHAADRIVQVLKDYLAP